MTKKFKLTKNEARLVRIGLRIYKESCEIGPSFDCFCKSDDIRYEREAKKCKRDLAVIKKLLADLKGM